MRGSLVRRRVPCFHWQGPEEVNFLGNICSWCEMIVCADPWQNSSCACQWKKKTEKSQTGDDKECKSGSASQKFSWLLWKCLSLYYAPEISCWFLPKHSRTTPLWNKSIQKLSLRGHLFFQSYFCFPDLCFEEVSLLRSVSRKIWASPCLQNYVVFRPLYGTCQTRLCFLWWHLVILWIVWRISLEVVTC